MVHCNWEEQVMVTADSSPDWRRVVAELGIIAACVVANQRCAPHDPPSCANSKHS